MEHAKVFTTSFVWGHSQGVGDPVLSYYLTLWKTFAASNFHIFHNFLDCEHYFDDAKKEFQSFRNFEHIQENLEMRKLIPSFQNCEINLFQS